MFLIAYIAAYAGIAVFLVAVIARIVYWAKMPMHVRWELYPVAHEGEKAAYGGSYLEEFEWWKQKRHTSLWGEIKAMGLEIFFLVALWEHNRKMWFRSFPFHFGLYLVAAATAVMIFAALLAAIWPAAVAGWFGGVLQTLVVILGIGGLGLGLLGALGLLQRRLSDEDLKDATAPVDIFNLVFFIGAFGLALLTWLTVDLGFGRVMTFVHNLVTFNLVALPGSGAEVWLPALTAIALSALLAYIPLTHMSHFVGKYFGYHTIRWNDKPNLAGGEDEEAIEGVLSLPVGWSAGHIRSDGEKSWAEVATEELEK